MDFKRACVEIQNFVSQVSPRVGRIRQDKFRTVRIRKGIAVEKKCCFQGDFKAVLRRF